MPDEKTEAELIAEHRALRDAEVEEREQDALAASQKQFGSSQFSLQCRCVDAATDHTVVALRDDDVAELRCEQCGRVASLPSAQLKRLPKA